MRAHDHQASPMSAVPFTNLTLRSELQSSIAIQGYESMTPVQEQTLPHLLSGKDLIAQAKTGSGKTAAFAIALLNKLDANYIALKRWFYARPGNWQIR